MNSGFINFANFKLVVHQTHKINESKNQPNNEFIMNITKEESDSTIQNINNFPKSPRVSATSELPNLDVEVYNYQRLSRVEHANCNGSGVKDGLVNRVASDPELSTAAAAKIILPPVFVPKQFGVANYHGCLQEEPGFFFCTRPNFCFYVFVLTRAFRKTKFPIRRPGTFKS